MDHHLREHNIHTGNMQLVFTTFESYCGMGKSWQKVGTMADSNGSLKYPQLLALMKCVLSFSRENAVPERDFYE